MFGWQLRWAKPERVDVLRDACRLCGDQPIVVVLLSSQVMST